MIRVFVLTVTLQEKVRLPISSYTSASPGVVAGSGYGIAVKRRETPVDSG